MLQHRDEICSGVNVKKIKGFGNQQRSCEQQNVQRLLIEISLASSEAKWRALNCNMQHGEDIVYTIMKVIEKIFVLYKYQSLI